MGVTDMMIDEVTAEEATCAVCDRPVRYVLSEPYLRQATANAVVYKPMAWCLLEPCGHTFTVRRGGLIY